MTLFWVAVGESFDDLFDAPLLATHAFGGGDVPASPARQPVDGTARPGSTSLLPGLGLRNHGVA